MAGGKDAAFAAMRAAMIAKGKQSKKRKARGGPAEKWPGVAPASAFAHEAGQIKYERERERAAGPKKSR